MAENVTTTTASTTGSSGMPLHKSASQASLALDGATVATVVHTVAGGGGGVDGLNGGILADDDNAAMAINGSDAITERIRKTSQFLSVVDQELRHLSITEVSETEDEEQLKSVSNIKFLIEVQFWAKTFSNLIQEFEEEELNEASFCCKDKTKDPGTMFKRKSVVFSLA